MTTPKITLSTTRTNHTITHGVLYTVFAVVFFFGIVLAIAGAFLGWPPQLATVHIGCGLVIGVLGIRAEIEQRRLEKLKAQEAIDHAEQTLSEVDQLERWANNPDSK